MIPEIQEVGRRQAKNIIMGRSPVGKFYFREFNGTYVGIDNSKGGDPITKDFVTYESCMEWLVGEK